MWKKTFPVLFIFVIKLTISYVRAEIRTFNIPSMCLPRKQIMYDCSPQFPSLHTNSCLIYNTEACKRNEFVPWEMEALRKPLQESNSEFTIDILPYAAYIEDIQKDHPVSAINILLTSYNKSITGYSIIMSDASARNDKINESCRIIDFRNAVDSIDVPFTFFYDCYNYIRESEWGDVVSLSFKAFPLNVEMSYFVYVPSVSKEAYLPSIQTSSCDWTPLVMINRESLKHSVQLKFSKSPSERNISSIVVTLLDSSSSTIEEIKIPSNENNHTSSDKNRMIATQFQSVSGGFYAVSIRIIQSENNSSCAVFKSGLFLVGMEARDYSLETFLTLSIIAIICMFLLGCWACQQYLKSAVSSSAPTLLLVYFHKQLQHEFLVMFAEFLENHYGVKVYPIYKRSGNPKAYLEEAFTKCDIIVFVISEGLLQIFEEANPPCEEDHYWVEQLPETKALIDNSRTGSKKFCKICFPYSGKQHVPKCLKRKGPLFKLMGKVDNIDKFLCYIFNCSSNLSVANTMCCVKHHTIETSHDKKEDYKKLKEKLKNVVENKSRDTLVPIDNPIKVDVENVWIKRSNLKSEDDEKNFIKMSNIAGKQLFSSPSGAEINNGHSNILSSDNKDEKQNDNIDKERDNVASGSSENECQTENVDLAENAYHVRDDFIRFCVSKMVNFER